VSNNRDYRNNSHSNKLLMLFQSDGKTVRPVFSEIRQAQRLSIASTIGRIYGCNFVT
jgi:hypothetical protein